MFATLVLGGIAGLSFLQIVFEERKGLVVVTSLLGALYVLCRVMMVMIALMAFRQSPAGVYTKPSWDSYWGHI